MCHARRMPIGRITRGTTGTNRLRRVDRWIARQPAFLTAASPFVVDLGYGASGATAFELRERLARTRQATRVTGLEIDPERVRTARAQLAEQPAEVRAHVAFAIGGFEVPLPRGERPDVIRAFNVLRQYDEPEVAAAWASLRGRLAPGGLIVEGTCNEIGRVASWFGLDAAGPRTFTISLHLASLDAPSIVAERLPKALIHRNVPGERVHRLLTEFDDAWAREAPLATFSPRQRFIAAVGRLRQAGWPVHGGPREWRLGEVTLDAHAVAPLDAEWSGAGSAHARE